MTGRGINQQSPGHHFSCIVNASGLPEVRIPNPGIAAEPTVCYDQATMAVHNARGILDVLGIRPSESDTNLEMT